jgi:hypothetical protein
MKLIKLTLALALLLCGLPVPVFAATPTATSFTTAVPVSVSSYIQLQGADADGTALTFATTTSPTHGTLSQFDASTGVVIYTPASGYVGSDSFNYTVTSGGQTSSAATVTITVTNAKTRIISTLANPDGTPRQGKVTFILTQVASSPAGLIPAGSSVSAVLDATGKFDVSVYPSRAVSPQQYYQVYFVDAGGAQQRLGLYDIPASPTTITFEPYKVTNAALDAQYTFAPVQAVTALAAQLASSTATLVRAQNSLNTGLGAFWKLDEAAGTRIDTAGTANLSTSGGAVPQVSGKLGYGASFTAGGPLLFTADAPGISSTGLTSSLTIAGWCKRGNETAGHILLHKDTADGLNRDYEVAIDNADGLLKFNVSANGTSWTKTVAASSFGPVTAGSWDFFVAWYDAAAQTLNLQVNNGPVNSVSYSAGVNHGTGPLYVGGWAGGSNPFVGSLDAIGIWQKALTATERADLFNNGDGREALFTTTPGALAVTSSTEFTHEMQRDFNASGIDTLTTGSITSGTKNLTVVDSLRFSVGQGIRIEGAGALGVDLLSTVTSANGVNIVIADNASTTVSTQWVQHDDTLAIQSEINQCKANLGCADLWPEGGYPVNGPVLTTYNGQACNSQLCLPSGASEPWTLKWRTRFVNRNHEGGAPSHGVRVISNRVTGNGVFPALLSAGTWTNLYAQQGSFNVVVPDIEGFVFVGATNPTLSVLNFHQAISARVAKSFFITGEADPATQPTHNQATAVIAPGASNRIFISLEYTSVFGYYEGYRLSEGAKLYEASAYRCARGYVVEPSNGELAGTLVAAHCPIFLYFEGSATVNFQLSVERYDTGTSGSAQWYSSSAGNDIVAASGVTPSGKIEYHLNIANIGPSTSNFSTTRATNVECVNLTAPYSASTRRGQCTP